IKRGSPNPKLAHSVQRGKIVPSFHWPAASSHDAMWNATSCPEAVPSRKNGASTASDTHTETIAASPHSRRRCLDEAVESGRGDSLIGCSCDCNRKTIRCAKLLSRQQAKPALLAKFARKINQLPHVVIRVPRTAQKNRKALRGF